MPARSHNSARCLLVSSSSLLRSLLRRPSAAASLSVPPAFASTPSVHTPLLSNHPFIELSCPLCAPLAKTQRAGALTLPAPLSFALSLTRVRKSGERWTESSSDPLFCWDPSRAAGKGEGIGAASHADSNRGEEIGQRRRPAELHSEDRQTAHTTHVGASNAARKPRERALNHRIRAHQLAALRIASHHRRGFPFVSRTNFKQSRNTTRSNHKIGLKIDCLSLYEGWREVLTV